MAEANILDRIARLVPHGALVRLAEKLETAEGRHLDGELTLVLELHRGRAKRGRIQPPWEQFDLCDRPEREVTTRMDLDSRRRPIPGTEQVRTVA